MYPTIYQQPEKFGLREYGEADAGGGYEFDQFVIWTDPAGTFYWASDRGCSCPTPFEDYGRDNIKQGSLRDALVDLRAWITENDWSESSRSVAARRLVDRIQEDLAAP